MCSAFIDAAKNGSGGGTRTPDTRIMITPVLLKNSKQTNASTGSATVMQKYCKNRATATFPDLRYMNSDDELNAAVAGGL